MLTSTDRIGHGGFLRRTVLTLTQNAEAAGHVTPGKRHKAFATRGQLLTNPLTSSMTAIPSRHHQDAVMRAKLSRPPPDAHPCHDDEHALRRTGALLGDNNPIPPSPALPWYRPDDATEMFTHADRQKPISSGLLWAACPRAYRVATDKIVSIHQIRAARDDGVAADLFASIICRRVKEQKSAGLRRRRNPRFRLGAATPLPAIHPAAGATAKIPTDTHMGYRGAPAQARRPAGRQAKRPARRRLLTPTPRPSSTPISSALIRLPPAQTFSPPSSRSTRMQHIASATATKIARGRYSAACPRPPTS